MNKKILSDIIIIILILLFLFFVIFTNYYNYINAIIWAITTVMILGCGFFYSFKLNFVQLKFKEMFKSLFSVSGDGVSTIQSLTVSLGGRVGVGSLAGVALAIYIGGAGSIFWMWITSIIASSNTYVEAMLGVIFREKDTKSINRGGPSYYIKKGLGYKKLAFFYATLIIVAYIGGFLSIQSNTIVKSITNQININPIFILIIIAIAVSLIIYKGVKEIAKFTSKIVTVMGIIYILIGIYVIILNISKIPLVFIYILKSAFTFESFLGGFLQTLIIGMQRGIFSNEAGLGTSAIASAMTNDKPHKQGLVQVLGIHFTTLVVCTITAIIILTSNYNTLVFNDLNGIEITQYAFNYHLGNFGSIILTIVVVLFAFSTIISGYYYGENNLKFLKPNISKKNLDLFKTITIIILFLGGIITSTFIWNIVDIFVGLLAIINIYAIYKLSNIVLEEYFYRKKK